MNAKLSRSKKGGFKAHMIHSPTTHNYSPKENKKVILDGKCIENTPEEPVDYKAHLKIGKSASKINSKKKNNFGYKDSTIINVQHSNTVVKKQKQ